MKSGKRRQQLFNDYKLQGALLAHAAIYWFYCLFSVAVIAVFWIILTQSPESSTDLFTQLWLNCGPALLGSVLLLPLVLLDCLRLSNRFAGPMVRMQRAMQTLAAGDHPEEVRLRPSDYWQDFANDLNIVIRQKNDQLTPREVADTPSNIPVEPAVAPPPTNDSEAIVPPRESTPVAPLEGPVSGQNIYSDITP